MEKMHIDDTDTLYMATTLSFKRRHLLI